MGSRQGGITVFLTLTGLLIFAMLGTMVETARYTVCKNHAARTLRTSIEGLMTEYSRPLYDNYRLFVIESSGTPYEKVIAGYVGDTFEAAQGAMDFLAGQTDSVKVTERVYIGDDGAAALQEEINSYMQRRLTKKQLDKFLKKSQKVSETEDKAKEIEDTVSEEKELAVLDQQVLELMKTIDGITVKSGRVTCGKEFVKMFATGEVKGENFGVSNSTVWKAMKAKLDKTPRKWKGAETAVFKARVQGVRKLTERALAQAENLKKDFAGVRKGTGKFSEHRQWMEQFIRSLSVLEGNAEILAETETILAGDWEEEKKEKLTALWQDYDTSSIMFDYTGIDVSADEESPLDALSSAFGGGILKLVAEKDKEISSAQIKNPDNYAKYYKEKSRGTDGEDYSGRTKDLTEKGEVRLSGVAPVLNYAMNEFCLDSYLQEEFKNYTDTGQKKWKTALKYQWEYVVAGGKSDKNNLEAVLNRILLIRTVINFAAIYRDNGKKAEAYATAAALVGFTGMEPLVRLTQTLILIAWSMVESLVDVAGILQGRNVPLVKSPAQILTSYAELLHISQTAITRRAKKWKKEKGTAFGYQDYIKVFLAAEKPALRRYRIMDLIQWDMKKNGYSAFDLGTCVFSMKVKGVFTFPARLFRMAPVEALLGRDIRSYPAVCEVSLSYL